MHYYKKNIGDYAKKTGRISILAHGAYTLLIDACYDRERFPTRDEAIDWIGAESEQEVRAIDEVLRKFFTLENGFYVQKRIKEEIEAYRQKSIKNKEIAINRETKRKEACTKRVRTKQDREPNHKPITNNHKPITIKKHKSISSEIDLSDVPEQILSDFAELRKERRAPLTFTAIKGIRSQASQLGLELAEAIEICCNQGWTGFRASWVREKINEISFKPHQTEKEKIRAWMDGLIGKKTERQHAIIDI